MNNSKPAPVVTSQQLFSARVSSLGQGEYGWMFEVKPEDRATVARLCSDDRMQRAWDLTADLSDDEFASFILDLTAAWACGRNISEMRRDNEAAHEAIEAAHEAIEAARVALRRLRTQVIRPGWGPVSMLDLSDAGACMEHMDALLAKWDASAQGMLRECAELVSRKTASVDRTEFAGAAVRLMTEVFGKPHYEIVADLANVIFPEAGEDAETIRSASRKRKARLDKLEVEPPAYSHD